MGFQSTSDPLNFPIIALQRSVPFPLSKPAFYRVEKGGTANLDCDIRLVPLTLFYSGELKLSVKHIWVPYTILFAFSTQKLNFIPYKVMLSSTVRVRWL